LCNIAACFIAPRADPCNKIKLFCKFATPLLALRQIVPAESSTASTTQVVLLVHPEAIVFGADLCFIAVFFKFQSRDLRDASADGREILHSDQ